MTRPFFRRLLSLALALSVLSAWTAQAQTPLVLETNLNGEDRGTILFVESDGRLFLAEDDARNLRLRPPAEADLAFQARRYFALATLAVEVVSLDRTALRVVLRAAAGAFEPSTVSGRGLEYAVTPAGVGGFFNYDLLGTRFAHRTAADGAFELGAFAPAGVLTHQFVARNLYTDDNSPRSYQRVATAWRKDWPEQTLTAEIGDAVSRAGATGRALRFGGAAVRTNYGLRPGFVQQPLPVFSGEAAVPSTVQVFVQNQLRTTTSIEPGPFTIDNVPIILGAGDARVVVRDALGREQVITSSFYAAGGLLRPGLTDYALAAGRLRTTGAPGGADYGNHFASGLWRQGLTSNVTVEARVEAESGMTRVGGAAIDVGGRLGEVEAAAAVASVPGRGTYALLAAGYRYLDFDNSVTARWEQAQDGFRFAGETEASPTPRRQILFAASRRLGMGWNVGAALIDTVNHDASRTRSANLSTFVALGANVSLLMTFNRVRDATGSRSLASVSLLFPLGPHTSFNASVDGGAEARQSVSLIRALPMDEGWGYRLAATHRAVGTRVEAAASAQIPAATLNADVVKDSGQTTALRAGASGSLGLVGDTLFASRSIVDSFAVVRLQDVEDVPILLNNQRAGRTDARGRLLLPRLFAYLPNEVRVDPDTLPPDVEIRSDRAQIVAPYRSGVVVDLDVKRVASALVRLRTRDGVVPAGASVTVAPDATASGVAQRGEFYLSGQPGRKRAVIQWRGQSCSIDLELPARPPAGAVFHQLGPFECPDIQP